MTNASRGKLAQVSVRAAHVAVVFAETQQLSVSYFVKSLAQSFEFNVV
jgi:hypothetical protein